MVGISVPILIQIDGPLAVHPEQLNHGKLPMVGVHLYQNLNPAYNSPCLLPHAYASTSEPVRSTRGADKLNPRATYRWEVGVGNFRL